MYKNLVLNLLAAISLSTRLAVVEIKGHSTLGGIQEEGNYLANLDSNKELDNHKQTLTEVHGMVNILLYLPDCYICSLKMRMALTMAQGGR